jgi:selenophosphate synthetase-related protein
MGQGMLLITPQPEAVIAIARQHSITAQIIGEVTTQPGIRLRSRGYFSTFSTVSTVSTGNEVLVFPG